MTKLTNFERVQIQMEYVVPLIKDLQRTLGEEAVLDALQRRNELRTAAVESNKTPDFSRLEQGAEKFAEGGALAYEIIASGEDHFDMNVTQCRYAEMMEKLGGREFGHLLVCSGDFAAARRIGMTLERSQTKMQGAAFCDFRYRPGTDQDTRGDV